MGLPCNCCDLCGLKTTVLFNTCRKMAFQKCKLKDFESLKELIKSAFPADSIESVDLESDYAQVSPFAGTASSGEKAVVNLVDGEKVNLFVKICKKGSGPAGYNDTLHTFDKEIFFYSTVMNEIGNVDDAIKEMVPKCYAIGTSNGDIFIVLEDFLIQGYRDEYGNFGTSFNVGKIALV